MGDEESLRFPLMDIVTRLARMEGAAKASTAALDSRLERIDNTIDTNHREAELSRRSLHESVADMRGKMRVFEQEVEHLTHQVTLMAPMSTVTALSDSHAALDRAVADLKETRAQVQGAAEGVRHMGKGMWALLMAFGSFIGGGIVALVEHIITGPHPPPH